MKQLLNKLHAKRKKGFTLLEMLVVVVIIGVMTAIAVPIYTKSMRQSRVADGLNMLDVLASAQNKYFVQHGKYAADLAALNAPVKKSAINEDFAIKTTNFTYRKEQEKSCIYATSADGSYTIAKNYKKNSRPVCSGDGCANLSSFVQTGNLDDTCPKGDEGCTLTESICVANGYAGFDEEHCKCIPSSCTLSLEKCQEQGCTSFSVTHCQCTGCSHHCVEGSTQWVDLGTNCDVGVQHKEVPCGHNIIQQKCDHGAWVNTDVTDCSNQWLISQCGGEGNVNWVPKCDCKKDIYCKYKGGSYAVGQTFYTGYTDDTEGECSKENSTTSSSLSRLLTPKSGRTASNDGSIKCFMKHTLKRCKTDTTWEEDFECVNKTNYCAQLGLVLDEETCDCVPENPEPMQTSCDENNKPACDGQVTGPANACGRGSSTNSNSGSGTSVYVPCEFLCGYTQDKAVCNETTNQWEGCESELKTYNPQIPRSQACQGQGTEGSACGSKMLLSITCDLQEPYSELNFNATGTYSEECTLPYGACWEGAEEIQIMGNGKTYKRTCTNCTWGQWERTCPEDQTPTNNNKQVCHVKDGVTNEDLYCGTMTATQKKCDASTGYEWQWDFTNATCQNVKTKPDPVSTNSPCGGTGSCRRAVKGHKCALSGSNYDWIVDDNNMTCVLPAGACEHVGDDYLDGTYCMYNCRRASCATGVYNENLKRCLKPLESTINGFYKGVGTPGPTSSASSTSQVRYYHCSSETVTNLECGKTPKCGYYGTIQPKEISPSTASNCTEYCRTTNNATAIAAKKVNEVGACNLNIPGQNKWAWGKGTMSVPYGIYRCQEGSYNYVN